MFGGIAAAGTDSIVYAASDGTVAFVDLDGPRVTGQFTVYPCGPAKVYVSACAVTEDGSVLLADALHRRVRRFARDGRQTLLVGARPNPGIVQQDTAGVLDEPNAVLPLGDEILVACGGSDAEHGVQVFGSDGKYRRSFAAPPCGWRSASGLAEVNGRIWVAEKGSGQIRVHSPDGRATGLFPLEPDMRLIRCVRADGYGGGFALFGFEDYGVARIAEDGTLDGWTVKAGEESGQVLFPFDIAVLSDGRFVVADLPYDAPMEEDMCVDPPPRDVRDVRLQLFSSDGRCIATIFDGTAAFNAAVGTWLKSILARKDGSAATLYEQARVHHYHGGGEPGHLEQARGLYEAALKAEPTLFLARLGLATLLHRGLNDAKAAEAEYRRALEAGGPEGDLLARIAECRHDAGDLDGAIRTLQEAIESPRPPEEYHRLVEELGDYYLERE